jgi:glycosyltransferase involved in cell wall biosynthesis
MKITFLMVVFNDGGIERVNVNLINEFISNDYAVELIIFKKMNNDILKKLNDKVKVINLNSTNKIYSVCYLMLYFLKNKPAFIFSDKINSLNVAVLARIFSFSNVKIFYTQHGNYGFWLDKRGNNKAFYAKSQKKAFFSLKKADFVIAVSLGVLDDLLEKFSFLKDKSKVIYNPIYKEEILNKSIDLKHPWFEYSSVVFLSVGRLEEEKGYSTLLRSFALCREKFPCRLIVLGEGSQRKNLEALAIELNIDCDVDFYGFCPDPHYFYLHSSLFVLPSVTEGFAAVLVEAMSYGLNIVSTDCPFGPREILDNGKFGLLTPVGDIKAMADSMEYQLKNSLDKNTLIDRARYFSVKNSFIEYEKLLNEYTIL